MNLKVRAFATVALIEGLSYVLLLVIAMPLKYFFQFPYAVKIVGWAHGVLFMLYVIFLILCWIECKWSLKRVSLYFIASLLPILPFIVERRLKKEYASITK
ncbi:membrane protein [Cytophagales bacterium WSM2-2]|nr:membrane protein [Cytophagales bacterium WSM2-2]